eukprot:CAMPEP_0181229336 /NCGR_PEP_ID=MMETSP1096-20121128/33838_1 /TAXON_ID=156174 ORGANISM="Chrysochromulina ericina, Strain CCMP281" /NCGR_SAMPLE_ID=MMETSP1096 /ASSEMBLY_ACC=CAM_ASM_000453 /LENGTH=108 /DNA_ID=CAMNT_0023322943 /DNA_START=132 /DNA_END=458 /DNA_ORIENTATION=+
MDVPGAMPGARSLPPMNAKTPQFSPAPPAPLPNRTMRRKTLRLYPLYVGKPTNLVCTRGCAHLSHATPSPAATSSSTALRVAQAHEGRVEAVGCMGAHHWYRQWKGRE